MDFLRVGINFRDSPVSTEPLVLLVQLVSATAIQIPPVLPFAGKRNVELGPQPPATLLRMTLRVKSCTLGAATRLPTQVAFI